MSVSLFDTFCYSRYHIPRKLHISTSAVACRDQFEVTLQPEWVYELDSSHAGKFSRHLILRIPGVAFVNNWAVGHLVSQILAEPEVSSYLCTKQNAYLPCILFRYYTKALGSRLPRDRSLHLYMSRQAM